MIKPIEDEQEKLNPEETETDNIETEPPLPYPIHPILPELLIASLFGISPLDMTLNAIGNMPKEKIPELINFLKEKIRPETLNSLRKEMTKHLQECPTCKENKDSRQRLNFEIILKETGGGEGIFKKFFKKFL